MGNTQVNGCITALNYQQNSEQNCQVLEQITLDMLFCDGSITLTSNDPSPGLIKPEFTKHEFIKIENLNDFRETFQEAANFGHGVVLNIDYEKMQIVSLSIFPHQCLPEEKQVLALLKKSSKGGTQPPGHSPGG